VLTIVVPSKRNPPVVGSKDIGIFSPLGMKLMLVVDELINSPKRY
jgi:hypothetical protein